MIGIRNLPATRNVKLQTLLIGIVKGHYAEMYKKQDSMFVTKEQ
jgi:hypothetical protein